MIEQYDILTLDNGKDYVINKITKYNDKEYLLLVEVDENENLLEEKLVLEKIQTENGYSLSTIQDENLYKKVSEKFTELILQDLV